MILLFPAGSQVVVTDIEQPGRGGRQVQPGGDALVSAVTSDAFSVENRLNHGRVVQIAASPGFVLQLLRVAPRHSGLPGDSNRRTVFVTARAASSRSRRRLNKRSHGSDKPVVLVKKLEVNRAPGRGFKANASVLADGNDAVIDFRTPRQSGGNGKRLVQPIAARRRADAGRLFYNAKPFHVSPFNPLEILVNVCNKKTAGCFAPVGIVNQNRRDRTGENRNWVVKVNCRVG